MEQVQKHLDQARIPIRLSCHIRSGHPLVVSLWFVARAGALWCASLQDAGVVSFLRENPRCGFEIARDEPPYRGVRGWGEAMIVPEMGEEILRVLIRRYLPDERTPLARWLLSRSQQEVAIRIDPRRLITWDYTERMRESA
jgi:nitroimidazol reductase NimA-like FMN-containing flavoprotein (pyridoxamine 5'-phosphate oxidase superfamily)